jgi:hypothetical protein
LHNFVYDRSGNATSVVLVGGRIAGVWDVIAERREARFHSFGAIAAAVEERIRAELAQWEPSLPVRPSPSSESTA